MSEPMAYIGREPCGCVSAVTVDDPRHAEDTARFVADLIRDGCTVEHTTVAQARLLLKSCPHTPEWGRPAKTAQTKIAWEQPGANTVAIATQHVQATETAEKGPTGS